MAARRLVEQEVANGMQAVDNRIGLSRCVEHPFPGQATSLTSCIDILFFPP